MFPKSATALRVALFGFLAFVSGLGSAQLRADPSTWGAGQNGIRFQSEDLVDLRAPAPPPIDRYEYRRGLFSSMGLYEYKPMGAIPGQYSRPHYALGLHSDLMRDALSLTGLDAESCIAPLVRLRARESRITGATGMSLTLLARCTFH